MWSDKSQKLVKLDMKKSMLLITQNISPALWQIYLNDLVNITIKEFTTIYQQWLFLLITCRISTIYLLSISISDFLREGSIHANARTPSINKGPKEPSKYKFYFVKDDNKDQNPWHNSRGKVIHNPPHSVKWFR